MKKNKLTEEEKKERNSKYQKEYDKKRYAENREEILKQQKIRRDAKKRVYTEEQKLAKKQYRDSRKDEIRAYQREYTNRKRKEDPLFKLKANLRCRLYEIFRGKNLPKNSRTHEILGCSFEEFKVHLESLFESWMTWENRGLYNGTPNYGWDIDHIIPTSSATTEEELIKLNHYTNLQPLCSYINRDVKKNNLQ